MTPDRFEDRLAQFLFERSEEARAVRVGEKETSEQAAIVARYEDLFTREQYAELNAAEDGAPEGDARERLFRLRETCGGGLIVRELAEESDRLENDVLAARVEFKGETVPLRTAQAKLALVDDYAERDELGRLAADCSAGFNEQRLELLRKAEALEADITGEPDPVLRSEETKGIDLRVLSARLADAARRQDASFAPLRERWVDRILGEEREDEPMSWHVSYIPVSYTHLTLPTTPYV